MAQGGRGGYKRRERSGGEGIEKMSWKRSGVQISGGVWDQGGRGEQSRREERGVTGRLWEG